MKKYLIPFFLSLVFLLVQIVILSDYGINWDAPQRMLRGQAYAHIFLTGQKSYHQTDYLSPVLVTMDEYATRYSFSAFEGYNAVKLPPRPLPKLEFETVQKQTGKVSFYQHEDWNGERYLEKENLGHPPLVDILAALSNRLFFGVLGVLGDIESYQLIYILVGAVAVFVVCAFAMDISSSWVAGLVAGLSLALFPIFLAETHFNMKDPLQASFFAGSIWAFWKWVKTGKLSWFGGFVGFVALALGVKWNIVFLPFILIPWLILIKFKEWGRLWKLGILGGLGIILFLVVIWPVSWSNPPLYLYNLVDFYRWIGIGEDHAQPPGFLLGGFNIYPMILLLSQTPEIILGLIVLGVIRVIRGGRGDNLKTGYLLLLWFLIPLIRYSMPGVRSYNGIRQIMEVLPAMAVLAGVGAGYLMQKLNIKYQKYILKIKNFKFYIVILLFTFYILILLYPIIRLHPNQNVYFNALAGGLEGAFQKGLVDWSLTYGNVYKQGVNWLNEHAGKNANLAIVDGRMYAASFLWLREDISISPYHFSGLEHQGEYIMTVENPLDQPVFAYRFPKRFLTPIYTIIEDGAPIFYIYKNDLEQVRKGFQKEVSTDQFKVRSAHLPIGDYIEVDLGKQALVTRIVLEGVSDKCNVQNFVFADEFVAFVSDNSVGKNLSPGETFFAINERRALGEGRVEFSFPAEEARLIRIYPKSEFSCFSGSKISSVSYLSE